MKAHHLVTAIKEDIQLVDILVRHLMRILVSVFGRLTIFADVLNILGQGRGNYSWKGNKGNNNGGRKYDNSPGGYGGPQDRKVILIKNC